MMDNNAIDEYDDYKTNPLQEFLCLMKFEQKFDNLGNA